jgi:hypothetical protein
VFTRDAVAPASAVCYLDQADPAYAGFDTTEEITATLSAVRAALPPERIALADYALWRLGAPADSGTLPATAARERLDALLPRIRDNTVHAAVAALRASLAESST